MAIDYTKRSPQPTEEPAAAPGPVTKVTLTKSAPAVSLTKKGTSSGVLRVNLNWNARPPGAPQSGGFLRRMTGDSSAIDLDLGCLYEYTDGSKGVVQALGNAFRDRHTFGPEAICWLDGDDRSGTSAGGENLFVDLRRLDSIRRVLVFAFIYEGVPNWAGADAVVTLVPTSGPEVEVRLDEADARSRMCAIAMLENVGGVLSVRREIAYVQGSQAELDQRYGWGMRWAAGRK